MRTPRLEGATGHPHSSGGGGEKFVARAFFEKQGKLRRGRKFHTRDIIIGK